MTQLPRQSNRSLLPEPIARYFGVSPKSHAVITAQVFTPAGGWEPANGERPAGKRLAGFRSRGVTAIGVKLVGGNAIADFQVREL